ncbi:alpha/beta hydrolase [Anaerobacillus sp. MEB173]|uniref:alpha/beta hydrolase n=1 Tax=Anaerobacillus sp. MEB173 TaxID=3383345 RepID=UPI003F91D87B
MIGCLCIHGFTGEPYEVKPLADYLRKETDWLIYTPVLPGHGPNESLKGVTYKQWLHAAETALQRLQEHCKKVYIIGFSMGGMIAGYLASKYQVEKLVLLSAAAYYFNPKQLFMDIKGIVKDGFRGHLHHNELYQRYRRKIINTPMTATYQFTQTVRRVRPSLRKIEIPTLIIQGEQDGLIPKKSAQYLYNTIPAQKKEIRYFKKSKHMICHDCEKEQLCAEVYQFLHEDSFTQKKPS